MKAGILALAAALATGVVAHENHARRHAHEIFHLEKKGTYLTTGSAPEATCGCTTIYTTITGAPTLIGITPKSTSAPPPPPPPSSSSSSSVATSSTSTVVVVPTPLATTCPTPGVYTIPATTITLTESTTVCAATSTSVPSGTHTVGGVTTVVTTSTTVVCPYATVSTSSGVVTSTILTTTYVCPSAGTYTVVPPLTTSCSTSSIWVYPTPASYAPGTYTQSEIVTTITETDYVIFCPFTSPVPETPVSTYVPAPSTYAPAPTYSASPAPVQSTYAAPSPSYTSSSSSSSGSGSLGTSGDQWAITYTPYDNSGSCKSSAEVYIDIALIKLKGFSSVRVYSTDCSTLENVGGACKLSGLKMILGIFVSDTGLTGAQQQVSDISAWAQWDLVELIVVGNEAIFNGYCSASELASFISSCTSTWKSTGYSGLITTAEPLNIWQESTSALCGVVDVVGCNIHPFFNADVSCDDAGTFTKSQLDIVDGLCSGKSGINLETGWPSAGTANGLAIPGPSEQATAIAGLKAAVGGKSVMFSFTNDLWKPLGSFDCEQSWGMIDLFSDL